MEVIKRSDIVEKNKVMVGMEEQQLRKDKMVLYKEQR